VGFVVAVLLLGKAVDLQGPAVILPVLFIVYGVIWLSSLLVKDQNVIPKMEEQPALMSVIKTPAVIAFFVSCFLLQAGHGVYYGFYSIHMDEIGYSKTVIGILWAFGVVAEVLIFIVMHRLLERFGARLVLMASLLLAAVRWVMIGYFFDSLLLLFIAQVLHAATFGTFHAAAIHLVHHYFTGQHQGRGQALYSALSFGFGGALGTLVSGSLWSDGGAQTAYGLSAVISLIALAITWKWVVNELEEPV